MEMRESLHQGGLESLNVYFTGTGGGIDETTLGFATLPELSWLDNVKHDGVVLNERVLPGVYDWQFNLGQTATHEVGISIEKWRVP